MKYKVVITQYLGEDCYIDLPLEVVKYFDEIKDLQLIASFISNTISQAVKVM